MIVQEFHTQLLQILNYLYTMSFLDLLDLQAYLTSTLPPILNRIMGIIRCQCRKCLIQVLKLICTGINMIDYVLLGFLVQSYLFPGGESTYTVSARQRITLTLNQLVQG